MDRKSPYKHTVSSHTRTLNGKRVKVRSYTRGSGKPPSFKGTRRTVKTIHSMRSKKARAIDESKRAKIAKSETDWIKEPNRLDIIGLDYPSLGYNERQLVQIEKEFVKTAYHIWDDDFSKQAVNKVNVEVTVNKNLDELAQIKTEGKRVTVVGKLVKAPKRAILELSPRFFDLSKKDQVSVLRHEAGHLGYKTHNADFLDLMEVKGGTASESHLKTMTYKLQGKNYKNKYGRFKTIKTFKNRTSLMKFAEKYAETHPNTKLRLQV